MIHKKILLIYYEFPPIIGSSTPRIIRLIKYLGNFGWEPYVLTAKPKRKDLQNMNVVDENPKSIAVARANAPDLRSLHALFSHKIFWKLRIWKAIEWIENRFLSPDPQVLWKMNALRAGRKILKHVSVDMIFSSST